MIWRIILANLREASSELEDLRDRVDSVMHARQNLQNRERFGESDFFISLEHAYHHVNWAWNCRNQDEQRAIRCSDADYHAWEKFPAEFKDLWLPPSRCRGRAREPVNGVLHLQASKLALDEAVFKIDGLCCGIFKLIGKGIPKGFLDGRAPDSVAPMNERGFESQMHQLYVFMNKAWNNRKSVGASTEKSRQRSCYPRAFRRFWPTPDAAMRLHVRCVFDKCGQNLSKTAAALKMARNTVRKYL